MNKSRMQLDEVLDAIMRDEKEPGYDALQRWTARYPEFSEDLAGFFAAWALQSHEDEESTGDDVDTQSLANRLVSHALATRNNKRLAASAAAETQPQPSRLLAYAKSVGVSLADLAARARLDENLVLKLDLRRLKDVPDLCVALVHAALGPARGSLRFMLTGPPHAQTAASFKSKKRPVVVTEDFLTAIAQSSLPDASKAFWKTVVDVERSGRASHERMD